MRYLFLAPEGIPQIVDSGLSLLLPPQSFSVNYKSFDFFGRLCLLCIFSQNAGCIFTSGDSSGCCCSCCCFRGHSLRLTAPCHPLCPFRYWQYLLKLPGGKGYLILGVWAEYKLPHFSTLGEGSGSCWCFKWFGNIKSMPETVLWDAYMSSSYSASFPVSPGFLCSLHKYLTLR